VIAQALLLIGVLFFRGQAATPDDPRAVSPRQEVLSHPDVAMGGARLLTIQGRIILIAVGEVALPAGERADRAFALAATLAAIEARACAALFLDGQYSSRLESDRSRVTTVDGEERVHAWIKKQVMEMARVKLSNGEPLLYQRCEGAVRAVIAWGLPPKEERGLADTSEWLGAIADAACSKVDLPALDLNWVVRPDGSEGLLVTAAIHPDAPIGPAAHEGTTRVGCPCCLCREQNLRAKVLGMVTGWIAEGDLGVVNRLTRSHSNTLNVAKDGRRAIEQLSLKSASKKTETTSQAVLPGDMLRAWVTVFRHSDTRAVCVAFVPTLKDGAGATP
jgi:hypothetical protein